MNYYVDLILPVPLNQTFTYEINKSEYDFIQTGVRIAVPFGKSRIITGIVDKIYCNNDIIHWRFQNLCNVSYLWNNVCYFSYVFFFSNWVICSSNE